MFSVDCEIGLVHGVNDTAREQFRQANTTGVAEIQLLGTQKYTYWWSFGDGTSAVSEQIGAPVQQQHDYLDNGTYTVVLAVTYGIYGGANSIQIQIGP